MLLASLNTRQVSGSDDDMAAGYLTLLDLGIGKLLHHCFGSFVDGLDAAFIGISA